MMKVIVLVVIATMPCSLAWNVSLGSCLDTRESHADTVYYSAVHFWPLKSSSSLIDIIQCQAALAVYGNIRTLTTAGMSGISTDNDGGIKLASLTDACLANITRCVNGLSISMWLKLHASSSMSETSTFDVILESQNSAGNTSGILIYDHHDHGLQASFRTGNSEYIKTIGVQRGDWYHVAITWTHYEGIVHYIDGEMFSSNGTTTSRNTTESSTANDTVYLYLSYSTTAGIGKAAYRDLAVWNTRLTEAQVKSLYLQTPGCQEISPKEWIMTASSYSDHYSADNGYLYSHSAWCAHPQYTNSYLQIELPSLYKIKALVIQGKENGIKEYVKTFEVKYSFNAIEWKKTQVFIGPADATQKKMIAFDNLAMFARYFRLYPLTSSGRKCVRVRLCGHKIASLDITASVEHKNVNGQRSCKCSIKVNNEEYCPDQSGHNMVAISLTTGEVAGVNSFDTKNAISSTGNMLIQFLNSLPDGTLVIVAVKDSGHRIWADASASLYSIGANSTNPPPLNTAWILLGSKGILQTFIEEKTASSELGLLILQKQIPLEYGLRTSHFWPLSKTDYRTAHGDPKRPWYNYYYRDIVGALDFHHRHPGSISPLMGTIRIQSDGAIAYSKTHSSDCLFRPSNCPGGVTLSLWLKAEHDELLLGGEKNMPRYPLHKAFFGLYSGIIDGYVTIEGKKYSTTASTGHFVVLVDYTTGQVKAQEAFDVLNDATAEDRFASFLNEIPDGTIVLVVVKKESKVTSPSLIEALQTIGAQDPALTANSRYILLGYKGYERWDWMKEIKQVNSFHLKRTVTFLGAWKSEVKVDNITIKAVSSVDYLQLQLPRIVSVSGITTQGAASEAAWVTSYRLSYSIDGQSWVSVKDGSVVTEFAGNTDQDSKVLHTFGQTFNARLLRIIPVTFENTAVMRISVLTTNNAHAWLNHQPRQNKLDIPVGQKAFFWGTEDYRKKMTAITTRSPEYQLSFASLHNTATSGSKGCWCSENQEHVILKFKEKFLLTGIAIQGSPSSDDWITKFRLFYADDDNKIKYWRENGDKKNFKGNSDRHTVVYHELKTLIYTNNLRIMPKNYHNHTCMRFELYGYPTETACFGPLGVADKLPNHRLSASSIYNSSYAASKARIGLPNEAWCVTLNSQAEYLQVELGEATIVSGIATMGLNGFSYTKRFYLAYSQDGLEWSNHTMDNELKIMDGNTDDVSVVVNPIVPSIQARFIRVYPLESGSAIAACLKIELFGCYEAENPVFVLVGPLEIYAPVSSDFVLTGSYRYCRHAISCPGCKRQIYVEVFDQVKCVVPEVPYDCDYHHFAVPYRVPDTPQIYNIRMFDVLGDVCNNSMTRQVSGKIVGRVLAKSFRSKTCLDVLVKGHKESGVYQLANMPNNPAMPVYCDQMNHGGGWTVIQRRINGTVDFYRTWHEYKHGFGDIEGEFWIGNDNLHLLTSTPVELLIEMRKFSGHYYYAKYNTFMVKSEQDNYKLQVGGYSGTAGDSLSFHDGAAFSTKDKNNDPGHPDCAALFHSAWWFKQCKDVDLNGVYVGTDSQDTYRGIKWEGLLDLQRHLKSVQMKIRPKEDSTIKCSETECFYLLKEEKYNFASSHRACVNIGAELASITSSNQTTLVTDLLSKAAVKTAYIGLNDRIIEGDLVWTDRSKSSHSYTWSHRTDGQRDCVVVHDYGQNWHAVKCTWAYYPLCKRTGILCYKGFCYNPIQSSVTRNVASTTCEQHGMNLMKLETEDRIQYVTKTMMADTSPAGNVWTGLNDVDSEGTYEWQDKSSLTNLTWAPEAVDQNGDEDCVTLSPAGTFKAVLCSDTAGIICQKPRVASSCMELLEKGEVKNGVYSIHPDNTPEPVQVYCDQQQDGGGWEVFFRRQDGSVTFHDKSWENFKNGFGDLEKEFWLGLSSIARLGRRELILNIKDSTGQNKFIHYGYFDILTEANKFEARIGWYRGGTLGGEIGRINMMKFSTIDQDNDARVNVSCVESHGPGWLWTYIHYNRRDCFNAGYNLFGPYRPDAVGNETLNLFYNGVGLPIVYIEMKTRYSSGNARSVVGTGWPHIGHTYSGISLTYVPHQFTVHFSTITKAWFLVVSPSAYWSYYTFSLSEENGITSYENSLLLMQNEEFRNVSAVQTSRFHLNLYERYTPSQLYRFISRMKAWNRDLTANQINADFTHEYFTLDGDATQWFNADNNPHSWTINSNCTKSPDTGPCVDHTYGLTQGSYYYFEASYPVDESDKGSLMGPVLFPRHHKCFSFWYYMYGEQMGDLIVKIQTYKRTPYTLQVQQTEATILEKRGNQGKRWKSVMLQLDSSDIFSIKIIGIVGPGYKSDIAIDDLSILSECPANRPSNCDPPCKEGFLCLDDKGECNCTGLKHVDVSCHDVLNGTIFREASHYWPLEGTFNVTNLLGFTHGSTEGSVTSVPGPVNNALVTDGNSGQIVLGDLSSSCILAFASCTNGFTFWFWLKIPKNEAKERKVYLSLGHDVEQSRGIQVLQDFSVIDNPSHLIINSTIEGTSCVAGFEVHALIWSVIAVTWSRTNGLTIYHNGINVIQYQKHSCSSTPTVSPTSKLLRTGHGGVSPALTIDDTVIWYRELAAAEIRKIFRFFTAPTKTLRLSVKFPDEVFQDRLKDRESQEFNDFHNKILQNVQAIFTGQSINFKDIYINQLSNGSVNAHLSLFFHAITNKELQILRDAVCYQALNGMSVRLLSNTGTLFNSHSDKRQVTFCQSRPMLATYHHRLQNSTCWNITSKPVTVPSMTDHGRCHH